MSASDLNGLRVFTVEDKEAYLTEIKPSPIVIDIISRLSENNRPAHYLIDHIHKLLLQNKVSGFSERYFPTRLKRFYNVLLKEQEMLLKNIEYLSNL